MKNTQEWNGYLHHHLRKAGGNDNNKIVLDIKETETWEEQKIKKETFRKIRNEESYDLSFMDFKVINDKPKFEVVEIEKEPPLISKTAESQLFNAISLKEKSIRGLETETIKNE